MESILNALNYFNRNYVEYLAIIVGLILLIVLIKLLINIRKDLRLVNQTVDRTNELILKTKATETKCAVLKKDFVHKSDIFAKTFSLVALLKYYRKRENRKKEKEMKEYNKRQKQIARLFK